MGTSKVQLILTLVWALLFAPALLWWKESVPFLVFVSVYANFVGHWAAWEAAKAKEEAEAKEQEAETSKAEAEDVIEEAEASASSRRGSTPG
jgi:uncharacterized membrane protein